MPALWTETLRGPHELAPAQFLSLLSPTAQYPSASSYSSFCVSSAPWFSPPQGLYPCFALCLWCSTRCRLPSKLCIFFSRDLSSYCHDTPDGAGSLRFNLKSTMDCSITVKNSHALVTATSRVHYTAGQPSVHQTPSSAQRLTLSMSVEWMHKVVRIFCLL